MLLFAVPYARSLLLFLVVVILSAAIGAASPLIYRNIINNGILRGNAILIVHLAILVGILGLSDCMLSLAQTYLSAEIGAHIVLSLRTKLFDHIQLMPLAFFTHVQTGALVSRLDNDVTGAKSAFTNILSNIVNNFLTTVLVLGAMFVLSWQIALAAFMLLSFFFLAAYFGGRRLRKLINDSYNSTAVMNSLAFERFNAAGAHVVKLFGRRKDESKSFERAAARISHVGVKLTMYHNLFNTGLALVAALAVAMAYGFGGVLAVKQRLDVGTVVAFVAYIYRLSYGPIAGLWNIEESVMTALVSFERIFEVFDLPPMICESPEAVEIPIGPTRICFDRVCFRYPIASEISLASIESTAVPDKTARKTRLHNITFSVEPGQLIALVGPSGAGKTTITHLISRLYDVQNGSITINGIDVRDAKLDGLRQRIGTVTQDAHLFNDTIRGNLLYAKPDATDAELSEALQAAQILPLIEFLPRGLDTLVGERGFRFSGGEKQRLAIARLLLKSPDIVILDEATAHLDSESEAAIQKALETALRGHTSIVVAHRLSTVLKADRILVVQGGQIVEQGTHGELFERCGLYSELCRRQFVLSG